MGFDASQSLRYAMDQGLAVPSIVGVNPYAVYLVQILNDQVSFNDTSSSRIVSETRITVADGYRSYSALDGYLNPIVKQQNGEQLVLSNGQLTGNGILLGPIVFPYSMTVISGATITGGTDSMLFQPPQGSNNNTQIYIQLRGNALSPKGNFFDIKEVIISDMGGLSYTLLIEANSSVVV